ncbi:hypothetical protein [Psychrobacillus lasiicapitis]|uniref:Uncharacterized protein n=1 Tax=Psychrobacillus lasiicapitis TaxID=1636719 RepID=A0A544TAU5_9BACI|nr:hypothetical protein [Psychrobacillus lasiicapitis]TQR14549.1 hypothetical protein FG382_08850 [Psychrobacillus lasiicapitis]GGA30438.1 hypothetical protein GCM10011384_19830 [Psychrobacillus lasiicapitis]
MWQHLQEKQAQLIVKKNERDRLQRKQASLQTQRMELETVCKKLEEKRLKEQKDVLKLEKFSLSNLVSKWNGTMNEKQKKEISEATEVEMKYQEAEKTLSDLKKDIEIVKLELQNADYCLIDQHWESLMHEKKEWLYANTVDERQELENLYENRADLESMEKEIEEALVAGRAAKSALEQASSELDSASALSTWDTFLGGGVFVTAMKHNSLNSSQDYIHLAQMALRRFETELTDVKNIVTEVIQVDRSNFMTFTDYFFDNIFTDWMIHSQINTSKDRLEEVLDQVERVVEKLSTKMDEVKSELENVKDNLKSIIEM